MSLTALKAVTCQWKVADTEMHSVGFGETKAAAKKEVDLESA